MELCDMTAKQFRKLADKANAKPLDQTQSEVLEEILEAIRSSASKGFYFLVLMGDLGRKFRSDHRLIVSLSDMGFDVGNHGIVRWERDTNV